MRIALIAPKPEVVELDAYIGPMGLLYLSSCLRAHGHDVRVIDQDYDSSADSQVLSQVQAFGPALVGISAWYVNIRRSLALARDLKAATDLPVILGGIYPTLNPEVVRNEGVDLAVLGEGEATILDLVTRMAEGRTFAECRAEGLAGTAWRENGEVRTGPPRPRIQDLDSLPFPDRRGVDPTRVALPYIWPGKAGKRGLAVVGSRGCTMHCGFCSCWRLWGGAWVGRSPENVVEEIRTEIRDHGIERVFFADEEINSDKARSLGLYRLMRRERLGVSWVAGTAARATDIELAEAMVAAGMRNLFIGFESGAPEILKKLGKKYDPEEAVRLVRYLLKRGVFVLGNFITGLPWESRETLAQTIAFARRLNLDMYGLSFYRPHRGTPFHEVAVREGLLPESHQETDVDTRRPSIRSLHLSREEIQRGAGRFYLSIFGRPAYWLRLALRGFRDPARFLYYFKWIFFVSHTWGTLVPGMRSRPRE